MTQSSIRQRVLEHLETTGISVAELSRRTGVSYDVINKFKHRSGSTSAENGDKLKIYLDAFDMGAGSATNKRELVIRLASQLPDHVLDEALSMVKYLHTMKAPDDPTTNE